ncbi:PLP-dependent transferase [Exidia glandulosa HHB12029]|uniref:PLP-dependent transferase n=1 Tax=Exidia glandulosa HHB12029 TaxID=1314781 RepID=A0A165N6P2_EXIGL|nr:PLP-dependent transferase [Exidia glandulosa HHB12029]
MEGHEAEHEHSVTTHWPGHQFIDDWKNPTKRVEYLKFFKTVYPRIKPFGHVERDAEGLKTFATSPKRCDEEGLRPDEVTVRAFEAGTLRFFAAFYPVDRADQVAPYWANAGVGISGRFAQDLCKALDSAKLVEVPVDSAPAALDGNTASHVTLRERIASLLERAPLDGPRTAVTPEDVFLFPSGQSTIWKSHAVARRFRPRGASVVFGLSFQSTLHTIPDFTDGPDESYVFFGRGNELDELEALCHTEKAAGRGVSFVLAEFPSNPVARTPDLGRLRVLADIFGFILVIDDTISGFANVDVLGPRGADIVISSLTKAFNGHADVLAGCAVVNPSGPHYSQLTPLFKDVWQNALYERDAAVLVANSVEYLPRCKVLNDNAAALASFLECRAADPQSSVRAVYYPGIASCASKPNYEARMRPTTPDFTPGYGCLLSVEFDSVPATAAFFDAAGEYLHCGPHLGAHRTLILQYVKMAHGDELEMVGAYGYVETQIRVAVGWADAADDIIAKFKVGLDAADAVKATQMQRLEMRKAGPTV